MVAITIVIDFENAVLDLHKKRSESAKIALTLVAKAMIEFLSQVYDACHFYIVKDRNHKEFQCVHHLITPLLLCI